MKDENVIRSKSFDFAVRITNAYKYLTSEQKEFVISKQLLKSGVSIGANIEEAIGGQSRADFLSKLSISYKETRETIYWIRLLKATGYLTETISESLLSDAEELCRILGAIQKTIKSNT